MQLSRGYKKRFDLLCMNHRASEKKYFKNKNKKKQELNRKTII